MPTNNEERVSSRGNASRPSSSGNAHIADHASKSPQNSRSVRASSSLAPPPIGLPTPATSPQAHFTASSPSTLVAKQPRRMHNMSISSILSPDYRTASTCAQIPESSIETPSCSDYSAGSHSSVAEETPAQQFTWNEDPKKINDMLRSLNPDSAEWVVWKDWADFLEEERERVLAERKAAAATVQLVSSGSGSGEENHGMDGVVFGTPKCGERWTTLPIREKDTGKESETRLNCQPPSPLEIQKVRNIDESGITPMVRDEIVSRLMDTFFEQFGESMRDSSESDFSENSSERGSPSTEYSRKDVDDPSDGNHSVPHDNGSNRTSSTSAPARNDASSGPSSSRSTAKPTIRKRQRSSGGAGQSGGEEDGSGDKRSKRQSGKYRDDDNALMKLACPFHKRFPTRPPKCASCVFPGFASVHRLKEHLYRNHIRPVRIRCPRCYESFEEDFLLRAHAKAVERCPEREEPAEDDGLDQKQEKMLRCKKRAGRDASEEARWQQVFQICFPEVSVDDIPSPYCDQQQRQDSQSFERFQRQRLPQLVRQALDHAVRTEPQLAQLEESVRSQLVKIVRICQDQICEQYRNTTDRSAGDQGENDTHSDNRALERPPSVERPTPMIADDELNGFSDSTASTANFVDLPSIRSPGPTASFSALPLVVHDESFDGPSAPTSASNWYPYPGSDSGYGTRTPSSKYATEWSSFFPTIDDDAGEDPSGLGNPQLMIQSGFTGHEDWPPIMAPFPNYRND